MYLLFFDTIENNSAEKPVGKIVLKERKKEWEESELTEKTELSKSNISRALDLLESKGLVEKRRRGMGNIVLLK